MNIRVFWRLGGWDPVDIPVVKGGEIVSKCRGIGILLGHKYAPRYNYGEPTIKNMRGCAPWDAAKIIKASKPATYVCDICERCGHTIIQEAADHEQ